MLAEAAQEIERKLPDDALVLDIGGWASPFNRADWVVDLLPYATRGLYGAEVSSSEERFSAETWIERDICDREPLPFSDDQFDFVVCSHTLEDLRDPVWVCSEMSRVAKAGYLEVPHILEELCFGIVGPWVGWSHHRWICVEDEPGELTVIGKPGVIAAEGLHFPAGFHERIPPERRVLSIWWEGSIPASERVFFGEGTIDAFLADAVREGIAEFGRVPAAPSAPQPSTMGRVRRGLRRRLRRD